MTDIAEHHTFAETRTRPLLRGWIHVGALAAVLVAGPMLIISSDRPGEAACLSVYVISLVLLFGVSAAFHRVTWTPTVRRRLRRADHTTIFVAIAGTYTAIAGLALSGAAQAMVLTVVWCGVVAGIVLRQFWMDLPKWAVALPYVVVGWSALLVVPQLLNGLGGAGFGLLVAGGVVYTAGAIVYARKRPDPIPHIFGYHEVFHLCTLAGATLQFVTVAFFALPAAQR